MQPVDRHKQDKQDEQDEGEAPPGNGRSEAERAADRRQDERQVTEEAEEKSAASALVVARAVAMEGEEELRRPSSALAWSGLAAGLSMGFSLVAEGLLRSHLPDAHWRPLVAKMGYSVGFLIVVLGRQQLFTENTLTPVLPLLKHKDLGRLLNLLRLWAVVLLTNLIGAVVFAWVLARTETFNGEVKATFLAIGHEAIAHPFGILLLRGVFAGWLIALMVWLLPVAEVGRIWVILLMTYLVGLGEFSHIIAGSIEALYVVAAGGSSWGHYLGGYMLPTLIGNMLGGIALVAALNHAQVVAGQDPD